MYAEACAGMAFWVKWSLKWLALFKAEHSPPCNAMLDFFRDSAILENANYLIMC